MCSTSVVATQKYFCELKELDTLLRCGICYEFMKNTLITSCSHNYCSYCIRKFMQYKSQCPTCFKETSEPQLRSNRLVDQLIILFGKISLKIEDLIAEKNFHCGDINKPSDNNEKKLLGKTIVSEGQDDQSESPSETTPKLKILVPDMFTPRRKFKRRCPLIIEEPVQLVACPVCNVDIPERNINVHLDACLSKSKKENPESSLQISHRKTLPKLVYPLLQEKDLRRKLKEIGLSTLGDRKTLIRRHQRFAVLYNSECDSLNPRPVPEIVEQVANEEKIERKVLPSENSLTTARTWLSVDKKTDSKMIEEAQKQYLKENKSSFSDLVEKARDQGKRLPLSQSNEVHLNIITSAISGSVEQNDIESLSKQKEESSHTEIPSSPEICSIPGDEQNTFSDLQSSFDLFDIPPHVSHLHSSKPISKASAPGTSRALSPSPGSSSAADPFLSAGPSKVATTITTDTPGPSKVMSPPGTPESSNYSSDHPISPNLYTKPLRDSDKTPSPPFKNESTISPTISRKKPSGHEIPEPLIISDEGDAFGDWMEKVIEEEYHGAINRSKRRKKSSENPQPNGEAKSGRVLRKRRKK